MKASIEKDGQYFDFDESIIFNKSVKTVDAITNGSTFSYQASMQPTSNNKKLLGIENWDSTLSIFNNVDVKVHLSTIEFLAKLRVEEYVPDESISFSLFTDGFDFFNSLTGNLKDVPFRNYPYGSLSTRRTNTTGYVDFPINNGQNRFDISSLTVDGLVTSIYVKDIMHDILRSRGIKLQGEILNEWRYNHLFITNNSVYIEYDDLYIMDHTVFVGKSVDQSITGSTTIVFPIETGIFYDNPSWWNTSTSELSTDIQRVIAWEINLIFDTAGAHTISIFDDLSNLIESIVMGPADTSISWNDVSTVLTGRRWHVTVTPAAGTITCSSSSTAKFFVCNETYKDEILLRFFPDEILARFILPEMDLRDFVAQILSIFNPIINFEPNSKTLTVDLFENIKNREEVDWSNYVDSYKIDTSTIIDGYGKETFLNYDEGEEEILKLYNKRQPIPFGSGVLNIDNDFITNQEDLIDIEFPPTIQELNNDAQAYLPTLQYYDADGNENNFTNRLLLGVVNYPVSSFSNLSTINSISAMPYGWFVKPNVGKPSDKLKQTIAFQNPDLAGHDQLTLKDNYFLTFERMINSPIMGIFVMNLPANEFISFNPSTPKRIKTKEFNSLFFCRKIEGWEDSSISCLVELIKL